VGLGEFEREARSWDWPDHPPPRSRFALELPFSFPFRTPATQVTLTGDLTTSSPGPCPRSKWPRLPKGLQTFVRISSRKHDEMSSFCLNNGFRLQKKKNRAARRWKQPPKKPFHYVSRDKILHDSWIISAALARGLSNRHFERGEGPGDEVGVLIR